MWCSTSIEIELNRFLKRTMSDFIKIIEAQIADSKDFAKVKI